MSTVKDRLPGAALAAVVASFAVWIAGLPAIQSRGLSPLTVAIVVGMLIGNTIYPRIGAVAGPGVAFSRQTILRLGVVLYGFRLTLQDVGKIHAAGVVIDALMIVSTVVIAYLVGTRILGLERRTAVLVGSGSAICGAAAVLATEPVVRGKSEEVSVAVAGVVIFGTLSMFLYPVLYQMPALAAFIPGGPEGYGIYIGSTVHEVAQVVAAGQQVGVGAGGVALIAKMVRVFMMAPFLVALAYVVRGWSDSGAPISARAARAAIPVFAFGFVAAVLFNSLGLLPKPVVDAIFKTAVVLLSMAMAALGMSTHFGTLRRAGGRALVLALVLWLWLVVGGGLINRLVTLALA